MANIKSQIKRNRQNTTRLGRNKATKSELKTRTKKLLVAAEAGEPTDELFRLTQQRIDKAVSKGRLHPRTAARRKSRLARKINAAS